MKYPELNILFYIVALVSCSEGLTAQIIRILNTLKNPFCYHIAFLVQIIFAA